MPHPGAAEGRILRDRDLAGQLREQADGARQHVIQIDRLAQERLDRVPLSGRERTQLGELVDEDAIALVGRDPPG